MKSKEIMVDRVKMIKYMADDIKKESPHVSYEKIVLTLLGYYMPNATLTLQDVGLFFGFSRERARQVEIVCLKKLKHPIIARKLKRYVELRSSTEEVVSL